jgi:hypothetical protein
MKLLEDSPVGIISVMGVHQQHIGGPSVRAHKVYEPVVGEIVRLIADPG